MNSKKIIIVGAGLSGLSAAEEIIKVHPNSEITVLEALDRVGGRTYSVSIQDTIYDLGAQWIGPPQKYARDLSIRAKNQLLPQCHEGKKVLELNTKLNTYKTNIPKGVGIIPLIQMEYSLWKLDKMALKVPLDDPKNCEQAKYWDSMTIHTWIQDNLWFEKVRQLFECGVRAVLGAETNQVSFLFFLWFIHQNHGTNNLFNIQNGLQEKKLKFGTQQLSKFLLKQIEEKGVKVMLNTKVNKISQSQNCCELTTSQNETMKCDYLIMATPPYALKKIQFQPQLSRQRRLITDRFIMGNYTKMILLYDKQYWKEKGFSGETLSDCADCPILMAFDDSRCKENGQVQPGIVVFFSAGADRQWSKDRQMCKKVVPQKLASYYECEQLLNPIKIEMKVWNQEETIGGAPVAILPPGVLTQLSNIRKPEGRIHWAGTQMATISQGYMDGAIQSGIRAANEIIMLLKNPKIQKTILKERKQETESLKISKDGYWYNKIINCKRKFIEWW